jgi:glycosyltransferase involved in cell wall biosynthesis
MTADAPAWSMPRGRVCAGQSTMSVVTVTTCKGRLHHLKESAPTLRTQRVPRGVTYRSVVVDVDSPDGCFDWCTEQGLASIKLIGEPYKYFNPSIARNTGARQTESDVICFVDADILLDPLWLDAVVRELRAGAAFVTVKPYQPTCVGTFAVLRRAFDAARGYDESLIGWGAEDLDLYERLRRTEPEGFYPADLIRSIEHSNEDRVKHFQISRFQPAMMHNFHMWTRRRGDKGHVINPDGYGRLRGGHQCNAPWREAHG